MQPKKLPKILSRAFLYAIVVLSILFAFPKISNAPSTDSGLYSAPTKIRSQYFLLPIRIIQGSTVSVNKTPAPKPTKPLVAVNPTIQSPVQYIPTQPIQKTPSQASTLLSCASLNICDKIIVNEGYTVSQKVGYYNALLQTIKQLSDVLPTRMSVTNALYSITLSPKTDADRRGRGGSKTIALNTASMSNMQEFREVLTHEIGHVIDLGLLVGNSPLMSTAFVLGTTQFASDDPSVQFYSISRDNTSTRKASSSYVDFVGGYAMTSPFEDFAESLSMYLWHNKAFAQMATSSSLLAQKYAFMQNLFAGKYFQDDLKTKATVENNAKRRPRDSTRLSVE